MRTFEAAQGLSSEGIFGAKGSHQTSGSALSLKKGGVKASIHPVPVSGDVDASLCGLFSFSEVLAQA